MKISVIGASGTLGSCISFNLTVQKMADVLLMVSRPSDRLKGHWMDLNTAADALDVDVQCGGYEAMAGSDIVIETSGAPSGVIKSRLELLPANLAIVKEDVEKINRYCPEAIVIMETNPVDPLNYAMYLMRENRDRRKCIGYSVNDSIRFRMWAARALGVAGSRVDGTVIGEHGHSQVMLFSTLKVDGQTIKVDEEFKKKIRAQPPIMLHEYENLNPKRTAGWTCAIGTAFYVNAIKNDTRQVIPCNVVLEGEYGLRQMSMTVPAVLGKNGIEEVKVLKLAPDEEEGVKNTAEVLTPAMRYVEKYLGGKG